MTDEKNGRRAGRTFCLCIIALLGLLAIAVFAIHKVAASPLLLAAGVVVSLPLAAWIGGKGWASAMTVLGQWAKK